MPRSASILVRRAREVGLPGIANRLLAPLHAARQARAALRWRERFAGPRARDPLARELDPGLSAAGLREALARAPFFFDARREDLRDAFRARFPEAASQLLAQAEAALAGDLSWVAPGTTGDWHAVLPGCGRWPLAEPESTGYGAERPPGDVRLTWEIGRCPHLVRLAQATWLTGDERFARAVVRGMQSWLDENPVGLGIGWLHAQEVALRAVAWLWCLRLAGGAPAFDDATLRRAVAGLAVHGHYVEAYLADRVLTHNHLVSELGGLAVIGTALPMLRSARRWQAIGMRRLEREIRKQTDDEGVQGELSTHYHAFVLDTCLAVSTLADREGISLAADVRRRIEAMAELVALLIGPDGTIPAIGDTDAGRAWRLGLDPLDRRDALAVAAIAFGRGDLASIAGESAGAFFLAGGAPLPRPAAVPSRLLARCYRTAGLGISRSGYGPDSELVVFRAGATRFLRDVHTSHAHADALSVLWRKGANDVLLDPGTYLYSEGDGWRGAMRKTNAHGCVLIDGADQADVTTQRFGVLGLRAARWLGFDARPGEMRAEAMHPATGSPAVERRVAWCAGGLLALHDEVIGNGEHEVELWLQLPASRGEADGGAASLELENGEVVRVECLADGAKIALFRPDPGAAPGPGWRSPRYGVRRPGTALRIALGRHSLPLRNVTVVATGAAANGPRASVRHERDGSVVLCAAGREISFSKGGGTRMEFAS